MTFSAFTSSPPCLSTASPRPSFDQAVPGSDLKFRLLPGISSILSPPSPCSADSFSAVRRQLVFAHPYRLASRSLRTPSRQPLNIRSADFELPQLAGLNAGGSLAIKIAAVAYSPSWIGLQLEQRYSSLPHYCLEPIIYAVSPLSGGGPPMTLNYDCHLLSFIFHPLPLSQNCYPVLSLIHLPRANFPGQYWSSATR